MPPVGFMERHQDACRMEHSPCQQMLEESSLFSLWKRWWCLWGTWKQPARVCRRGWCSLWWTEIPKRGTQIGYKEKILSHEDSPGLMQAAQSLLSRDFKTQLDKSLSNLICPHRWPCFEQELRLQNSGDHFQPELWSFTRGIVPFSYSIIYHINLLTFLICNHVQKRDEISAFLTTNTPYLFYLPLSLLSPPYQKLFVAQKAVPLRKKKTTVKKKVLYCFQCTK